MAITWVNSQYNTDLKDDIPDEGYDKDGFITEKGMTYKYAGV